MFQQDSPAVMDDDTSTRDRPVHHVSDLYHGMQKDVADKGEIGWTEFEHHQQGEIGGNEFEHHQQGEISVSTERHQHKFVPSSSTQPEGTSNSSLDGDQIKNYINKYYAEKMAELVTLISKIPAEVIKALKNKENKQSEEEKIVDQQQSQEDESKKHDSPYKEDIQDVNAIDKEAGHEDDLENEDCSALKALEDVNVTAKEDGHDENLKKQECTDMEDDEVGGTITDSIQATIDIILFGLSTPSTTKSLDFGASNKMTESQWDLPDSQISPYFLDAQVQELEATKAKTPAKREKEVQNFKHLDVIFYHLIKKSKLHLGDNYRYTTTSCFFKTYVEKTHTRYYPTKSVVELSTQQDYAEFIVVSKNGDAIANIIHEFCIPAELPWHMVDEHYGVKKANEVYTSDNGDPPRSRNSVLEEIDASAIVTLE
ncbi:hypothetical protein CQW23_00837 [Capsicum baccatum]|uniref:Uncharacterized protein n=1 Tax=Capsicum baccatum TaxID=33114 RepID=A0A2G2XLV1_CAPBA|nr:hypothetical protein CQW23_00837 [Capsicum baccatum]